MRSVTDELKDSGANRFRGGEPDVVLPEGTEVFEIAGSFFFGAAQRFSEVLEEIRRSRRIVILRMRDVFAMDATGLHALEEVHQRFRKHGVILLLSGIRAQPLAVMEQSGALDRLGAANVLGSFREASVRAWEVVDDFPESRRPAG